MNFFLRPFLLIYWIEIEWSYILSPVKGNWIHSLKKTKELFLWCIFSVLYFPCCTFRVVFLCCIFYGVFFCVLFFRVVLFLFCIKSTSIFETPYYAIFLEMFWADSKEEIFLGVGQLGLIHYLVICLCLFRNSLSVSKLNCMMFFLLNLQIFSFHKR